MTAREYYRQMLVCALHNARRAETATELRDRAIGLALEHGAEPADVAGMTSAVTTAALRWLLEVGRVRKDGTRISARHGRGEPLYVLVFAEREIPVPAPPRPRPPSMQIAAIRDRAAASSKKNELEFYKGFAIDAARLLVQVDRLLADLRARQAPDYHDILRGGPCER